MLKIAAVLLLALSPCWAWAEGPAAEGETSQSDAACQSPASLSRARRVKALVRSVTLDWLNRDGEIEPKHYGLRLDDDWDKADAGRNVVVYLHGYNSGVKNCGCLLDAVRVTGAPCGVFCYPNDQALAESARLLSQELKGFGREHPDRRLSLLAYSMGGLVAREAIENPDLDPANVSQLIMIAPPSHGSGWAEIAVGVDIWEHCLRDERPGTVEYLYRSLEDGFGEAEDDLAPDSDFLTQLNTRPRNGNVTYTIFLGTGGRLDEEQLASVQAAIAEAADRNRVTRYLGSRIADLLAEANDALTPGDGAVSVERGQLEGVADIVLLPFDHFSVLDNPDHAGVQALRSAVLQRLAPTKAND